MKRPPLVFQINSNGFTLVEILVAIVVFALGILALNRLQISTITTNTGSHQLAQATSLARDQLDTLMSLNYSDTLLTDRNNNGDGQDTNSNGVDDDDEGTAKDGVTSFGLNETGTAAATAKNQADHPFAGDLLYGVAVPIPFTVITPLATYTIRWNVAEDLPISGSKTIRTIVTWTDKRNIPHTVRLDCVKGSSY